MLGNRSIKAAGVAVALGALPFLGGLVLSEQAHANPFNLQVYNNAPGGFSGNVLVTQTNGDVAFKFSNTSTPTTAKGPIISDIYFNNSLQGLSSPVLSNTTTPLVTFVNNGNLGDPPGGTNIGWENDTQFRFTAEPPPTDNGINPGEMWTVTFAFSGVFSDLLAQVNDFGIAVHVNDCTADGNSCAAVVPLPAALPLLLTGLGTLFGAGWIFRRREQEEEAAAA